jgi:hypothetical protein
MTPFLESTAIPNDKIMTIYTRERERAREERGREGETCDLKKFSVSFSSSSECGYVLEVRSEYLDASIP